MKEYYEILKGYFDLNGLDIRINEPFAKYTSLKIGGIVDVVIKPQIDSLPEIIEILKYNQIPYFVIGGGTNCLIMDSGINGIVILTDSFKDIKVLPPEGSFREVYAQAGCPLKRVINICADLGLSGMEAFAGIPGSIGGAIAGNAGSFGYEIKDVLKSIDIILPKYGRKRLNFSEISFDYRKASLPEGSIIIGATLLLKKDDPHYVLEKVRAYAKEKSLRQPLSKRSAGCVFKNPKGLFAGKLIDEAGCKGMRSGDIEVSSLHANFFINTGKGSSDDFLRLMDKVSDRVWRRFGVILEPEIRIIGRGAINVK